MENSKDVSAYSKLELVLKNWIINSEVICNLDFLVHKKVLVE